MKRWSQARKPGSRVCVRPTSLHESLESTQKIEMADQSDDKLLVTASPAPRRSALAAVALMLALAADVIAGGAGVDFRPSFCLFDDKGGEGVWAVHDLKR